VLGTGVVVTPTDGMILPLPRQINDTHTMVWEEASASNGVVDTASAFKKRTGPVQQITEKALENKNTSFAIAAQLASAGGYITGQQINPFLYMMFKSPTFKTHTLDWIFAPKSKKESDDLNKIINDLKKSALPTSNVGVLLGYPKIAMIKLNPNSHLFKFRPCAITSVSVNYSAAGTPSFFKDGAPAIVSLQLRLKEIEVWTQSNYDGEATGTGLGGIVNFVSGLL